MSAYCGGCTGALGSLAGGEGRTRRGFEAEVAMKAEPLTDLRRWLLLAPDSVTLECTALVGRDFDELPRCLFEDA